MNKFLSVGIIIMSLMLFACGPSSNQTQQKGPFLGNGIHNGWADHHSIVIWTRLTARPEGNATGIKFNDVSKKELKVLNEEANAAHIHKAQIPEGYQLKDMEGACPGAMCEVKLRYCEAGTQNWSTLEWAAVDSLKNYTKQWQLTNLKADTKYIVKIEVRKNAKSDISDGMLGQFVTPPMSDNAKEIDFCLVTCHDYWRKDTLNGHKIYDSMMDLAPDFYVHTGDVEYYDKPQPWAMTEELMRFKWDRLFALPLQREFWSKTTTYFIKDDHDALMNDAYPGKKYGTVSFERGLDIFDKEQFPSKELPYQTVRWGKDLQIWLVEGRNFRSKNTLADGSDKSIWGKAQKKWFIRTVKESDATFKVLITPTPILGPDRGVGKDDNHANEAFQHEGDELRTFINEQTNLFICNGDRHWQYVTHFENTNLWEYSCGAGADEHAGGWNEKDRRPEHRFLRVKGGFLRVSIRYEDNKAVIWFRHCDVNGKIVHEEKFFESIM